MSSLRSMPLAPAQMSRHSLPDAGSCKKFPRLAARICPGSRRVAHRPFPPCPPPNACVSSCLQRMTRHNDYYQHGDGGSPDPSNPWGNRAAAGASYGRALQRLGERYGITHWG